MSHSVPYLNIDMQDCPVADRIGDPGSSVAAALLIFCANSGNDFMRQIPHGRTITPDDIAAAGPSAEQCHAIATRFSAKCGGTAILRIYGVCGIENFESMTSFTKLSLSALAQLQYSAAEIEELRRIPRQYLPLKSFFECPLGNTYHLYPRHVHEDPDSQPFVFAQFVSVGYSHLYLPKCWLHCKSHVHDERNQLPVPEYSIFISSL